MEDKQAVAKAAARAAAHALEAKRQAEMEERTRKEEARQKLPLVSPKTDRPVERSGRTTGEGRPLDHPDQGSRRHSSRANYVEAQGGPIRQRQARTLPRVSAVPADYYEKTEYISKGEEFPDQTPNRVTDESSNSYGLTVTVVSTIISLLLIGLFWLKNILDKGPRIAMTLTMVALSITVFRIAFRGRKRKAERLASYFLGTAFLVVSLLIAYLVAKNLLF